MSIGTIEAITQTDERTVHQKAVDEAISALQSIRDDEEGQFVLTVATKANSEEYKLSSFRASDWNILGHSVVGWLDLQHVREFVIAYMKNIVR